MQGALETAKRLNIQHNVSIQVVDIGSGKVVQSHEGHNCATNSMLTGIGRYLLGDGVLNQGYHMLGAYVPLYISLGTMGLYSQEEDDLGLPVAIGGPADDDEEERFTAYMHSVPGYGADGYDANENNGRAQFGLGPPFDGVATNCELITPAFPRALISYREMIPETQAELPETIDVIFSAMISTGALSKFRGDADHIFITEAGLWSAKTWATWDSDPAIWEVSGNNGLLAGYRIAPPESDNWDMSELANRNILKQNVLRVGINQVVQVVWKIQLGSIDQFGGRLPQPKVDIIRADKAGVGTGAVDYVQELITIE